MAGAGAGTEAMEVSRGSPGTPVADSVGSADWGDSGGALVAKAGGMATSCRLSSRFLTPAHLRWKSLFRIPPARRSIPRFRARVHCLKIEFGLESRIRNPHNPFSRFS